MDLPNIHEKVLLDDDKLIYNKMISLKDIASVKIITMLWTNETCNILQNRSTRTFDGYSHTSNRVGEVEDAMHYIEVYIFHMISKLPLPKAITDTYLFKSISECVGSALISWVECHKIIFPNIDEYLYDIVWTLTGSINYQQTAMLMLQKEYYLNLKHRFEFACLYCCEEEVKRVFPLISKSDIINFSDSVELYEKPMVIYFLNQCSNGAFCHFLKENHKLDLGDTSLNEYLLKEILKNAQYTEHVMDDKLVGLNFLWNQLTTEEKSRNILEIIKYCGNNSLRYSLLSALNKDQLTEIFNNASNILIDMLNKWYSFQYFLPTAHHIITSLSVKTFRKIVQDLFVSYSYNSTLNSLYIDVESYADILQEFWILTPLHLKKSLLEESYGIVNIISGLINMNGSELAKFILSTFTVDEKEKVIFSEDGVRICAITIMYNEKFLDKLIGCFLCTESSIAALKRKVLCEKGMEVIHKLLKSKEWNEVENFLRWSLGCDEDIEKYKKEIMFLRWPGDDSIEMFHSQNEDKKYQLFYFRNHEIKQIERIFSREIAATTRFSSPHIRLGNLEANTRAVTMSDFRKTCFPAPRRFEEISPPLSPSSDSSDEI